MQYCGLLAAKKSHVKSFPGKFEHPFVVVEFDGARVVIVVLKKENKLFRKKNQKSLNKSSYSIQCLTNITRITFKRHIRE